ncbi:hypothetical protein BVC93_11400 [Mycobacterium sp. MS1601]|nr:hypothetical protein BVC93_11400 [Mycobacterium sp. MS1601]
MASIALTGAIALAALLSGAVLAVSGNTVAPKYCVLFAVAMALVAALGVTMRRHRHGLSSAVRTVDAAGVRATEVRYSATQFGILVALMTCLALLCLLGAAEAYLRSDSSGFPGLSVLLGGAGVFLASFGIAAATGRLRRGAVALSGAGISQRGWSFESRLDWSAVAGINPGHNGYPVILVIGYTNAEWTRRQITRIWRIDRLPPVPMIELDCRKFDIDPDALLRYLQTYVESAAARDELGTEAALIRARALEQSS